MTSRYLTPQLQKIGDPVRFFSLSLSLSLFSGGTFVLTKVPGSRIHGGKELLSDPAPFTGSMSLWVWWVSI